jgi:hypothetical protein
MYCVHQLYTVVLRHTIHMNEFQKAGGVDCQDLERGGGPISDNQVPISIDLKDVPNQA